MWLKHQASRHFRKDVLYCRCFKVKRKFAMIGQMSYNIPKEMPRRYANTPRRDDWIRASHMSIVPCAPVACHRSFFMSQEEWRDVIGWEGWYQVSDRGRIKRVAALPRRYNGWVTNGQKTSKGYRLSQLSRNGDHRTFTVHSLVLGAFVGPRPDGYEVNHINGTKSDNRLDNLEYVSPKENITHARDVLGFKYGYHPRPKKVIISRAVVRQGNRKLSYDAAREIRQLYHERKYSQVELGVMFGVSHTMIGRIVRGRAWVPTAMDSISPVIGELVELAKAAGLAVEIKNIKNGLSVTIENVFFEGGWLYLIRGE